MLSRLSLRYRIALVIFLLEACMLAAVLSVSLSQSHSTAADFNAASQKASLDLLSNLSVTALLTGEYSDYQLYIDDVKKQPSIVRILLVDARERVVASTQVDDVAHTASRFGRRGAGYAVRAVFRCRPDRVLLQDTQSGLGDRFLWDADHCSGRAGDGFCINPQVTACR
jgi:hypothetical protein